MKEILNHQNLPDMKKIEGQNLFYMKRYFLHHNPELAKPNFLMPKHIHKKNSDKLSFDKKLALKQNLSISNSYIQKMCLQFEKYLSILEKTDQVNNSCQFKSKLVAPSSYPISPDKNHTPIWL